MSDKFQYLIKTGDHENLWSLLQNKDFWNLETGDYDKGFHILQQSLEFFAARNGAEPTDDAHLCWLALRANELGVAAASDLRSVFQQIEHTPLNATSRMSDALARLQGLDETNFFKAALLLLWIECDRLSSLPPEGRVDGPVLDVIKAIKSYKFDQYLDINRFVAPSLVAWILMKISTILPHVNAGALLVYMSEVKDFLTQCREVLKKDINLKPHGVLWEVLENWLWNKDFYDPRDWAPSLILLLGEAGELEQAKSFIESITDLYTKAKALAALISVLFAREQIDDAISVAKQETNYPAVLVEALEKEINQRISVGDLKAAEIIANSISAHDSRALQFARLAYAFCKAGELEIGLECFTSAVVAAETVGSPAPLLKNITFIATAYKVTGEQRNALEGLLHRVETLVEQSDKNWVPIVQVWAALGDFNHSSSFVERLDGVQRVKALVSLSESMIKAEFGNTSQYEPVLALALQEARKIEWEYDRCLALLHVAFVLTTCHVGERVAEVFYEALAALRDYVVNTVMDEDRWTVVMIKNFFYYIAKTDDFIGRFKVATEILEIIWEMQNDWWKSEAMLNVPILLEILSTDEEVWQWMNKCLDITETIDNIYDRSKNQAALANFLANKGWYNYALQCFNQIEDVIIRTKNKVAFAKVLYSMNNIELAISIFTTSLTAVNKEHLDRCEEYIQVIVPLLECNLWDLVEAAVMVIKDHELRYRLLSEIAISKLQSGESIAARELFLKAISASHAIDVNSVESLDLDAMATIAKVFHHNGDSNKQTKLYKSIFAKICNINNIEERHKILLKWGRQVINNPSFEGRSQLLRGMISKDVNTFPNTWIRDDLLFEQAMLLVDAGEIESAKELSYCLNNVTKQAKILAAVARFESKAGRKETARDLLHQALDIVRGEEASGSYYTPQFDIVPSICELAVPNYQQELIQQVIVDLQNIEPDTMRAYILQEFGKKLTDFADELWVVDILYTLIGLIKEAERPALVLEIEERIVTVLARIGEFNEALAITKAINPSKWEHTNSLCRIVQELISRKLMKHAWDVFNLIVPEIPRVEALKYIASGLAVIENSLTSVALFSQYLQEVGKLEAVEHRSALLLKLVEALPLEAFSDELVELFSQEIIKLEREMYHAKSADARTSILCTIVKMWALLDNFKQAIAVLDKADAGEMAAPALEVLADLAVRQLKVSDQQYIFSKIRSYIDTFDDEESYIWGLISLAGTMAHSKRHHDSLAILEDTVLVLQELSSIIKEQNKMFLGIVRCLGQIENNVEGKRHIFDILIAMVGKIESQEQQIAILIEIANVLPSIENFHGVHIAINTEKVNSVARRRFVSAWQAALLRMPKPPLATMRYTLCCFPFEPSLGSKGSQCLAAVLLKNGQDDAYNTIVQQCPELALPKTVEVS